MSYNDKAHVTMEPRTRKMIIPTETKFIGIVGDNEGERVNIDIPRWYDGIDLGTKRLYIVVSNDSDPEQSDMIIPNIQMDNEMIHLTWVVLRRHVSSEGTVYAHVLAKDENGFKWQSLDGEYEVRSVNNGPDQMPEPQITAVEQTLTEMDEAKTKTLHAAAQALAAATVTAPPIVPTEKGETIALSDSAERPLRALTIYGRTTQEGTPSPEAPVKLESVGDDGSVEVNVKDGVVEGGNEHITIITQPRSVSTPANTVIMFSVVAEGEGLTYQWQKKDKPNFGWDNSYAEGANTKKITIRTVADNNGFNYRCVITDAKGNVAESDVATLTIAGDTTVYDNPVTVKTAAITTDSGLPGVPVNSGGNYTDANGQQWIADTIEYDADAGTGKHVQRVWYGRITSTSHKWAKHATVAGRYTVSNLTPALMKGVAPLCTAFIGNAGSKAETGYVFNNMGTQLGFNTPFATLDEWKAYLDANEIYLEYAIAEPIETALSADDLASLAALRTHYPNTTIYNSDGAYMSVNYIADTKLYIDNAVAAAITAAMTLNQ